MNKPMAQKVALITGGSQGIGRATAMAFSAQGASVVIASRRTELGLQVVHEISQAGGEASYYQANVSLEADVKSLFEFIQSTHGHLDFAFNNAGSGGRGGWTHEIAEQDWNKTIDGFLKSVWLCMKYEIQMMLPAGGGAIVNNSSVDGQRAFPWDPVYSAAKHGVLGLTKSAALQYAKQGIRINAVCPSWIRTPALEDLLKDPNAEDQILQHQPIGRLGRAEEVADAVVWLCSDQASMVLGTALAVDGGYLAL